jgi:hypothetical protein
LAKQILQFLIFQILLHGKHRIEILGFKVLGLRLGILLNFIPVRGIDTNVNPFA